MTGLLDISDSLEQAIMDPGLQDSTAALAEVILDSTLDSGVLKDIPIIGTVLALTRATLVIRDRLFLNKLLHFLKELHVVQAEQREAMVRKVNNSGRFRVTVGEKLLYILDRCEDHQTSQVIAMLFKAFLQQRISYDEFLRLAHAADRIMVNDLIAFATSDWDSTPVEDATDLLGSGLVDLTPLYIQVEDQDDWKVYEKYKVEGGDIKVCVTELGKTLRDILGSNKSGNAEQDTSTPTDKPAAGGSI